MDDRSILSEKHWVWPLVLFPYEIEDSHTMSFIGSGFVRGMKSGLARVALAVSNRGIVVRGRLSGVTHLEIAPEQLVSCEIVGEAPPMVEVRFATAHWSRFAKLLISGAPPGSTDRVMLNVASPRQWKQEIDRLILAL